jgi:hypothetical protein
MKNFPNLEDLIIEGLKTKNCYLKLNIPENSKLKKLVIVNIIPVGSFSEKLFNIEKFVFEPLYRNIVYNTKLNLECTEELKSITTENLFSLLTFSDRTIFKFQSLRGDNFFNLSKYFDKIVILIHDSCSCYNCEFNGKVTKYYFSMGNYEKLKLARLNLGMGNSYIHSDLKYENFHFQCKETFTNEWSLLINSFCSLGIESSIDNYSSYVELENFCYQKIYFFGEKHTVKFINPVGFKPKYHDMIEKEKFFIQVTTKTKVIKLIFHKQSNLTDDFIEVSACYRGIDYTTTDSVIDKDYIQKTLTFSKKT